MGKINLKSSIRVVSKTSKPSLRVKTSLSTKHLQSAAYFSRSSAKVEKRKKNIGRNSSVYYAYVTGAITLAVAALESTINELFIEAVHKNEKVFNHLPSYVPDLLCELWNQAERFSILEKYQLILSLAGKNKFDKGKSPYQEVDSVIRLRNALVHYKPEWEHEQKEHKNIKSRLKSKFTINPFAYSDQSFFPHKCLSHGCADWVVKSCVNFIEDFYKRLGLQPKWDKKTKVLFKTK